MTGQHEDCKPELVYETKNWICGCKTCDMANYVPTVGVERGKEKEKEEPAVEETETETEDGA